MYRAIGLFNCKWRFILFVEHGCYHKQYYHISTITTATYSVTGTVPQRLFVSLTAQLVVLPHHYQLP